MYEKSVHINIFFFAEEVPNPCQPSPCGTNALCTQRNGAGACSCIPDYQGNPYEGCRPECVLSSDCPTDRACVRNKCEDPCPGVCGQFAQCTVINHIPTCTCIPGYVGNPFASCTPQPSPRKFFFFIYIYLSFKIRLFYCMLQQSWPFSIYCNAVLKFKNIFSALNLFIF